MSAQNWTPAVKAGLVPLHPLTFGALIGKPFAALRHNPKVLFGFAIVIQLVIAVVTLVVVGAVALATFARIESLSPSNPDFYPVLWGTIAINGLVVLAMSFVSLAFTAVMQGVVAADIGEAALGQKAPLGRLWKRMRPAFWRLIGWSLLQALAAIVLMVVIGGIIALGVMAGVGGSGEGVAVTVVIGILVVLAAIPLWVWLSTKLLLVPSVLVLEHARLRPALVRSWRLTRGRFWNTFGVMFLISIIMSIAVSVISVPLSLLGTLLLPVIAPTGGADEVTTFAMGMLAGVAPQLLVYVLQAVAIVVQCAAGAFIYLDCRMRYEGLDHSLITYLERRDLGATDAELGDPFAVDPERAVSSAPPPAQTPQYAASPVGWDQYAGAPQYPAQEYPAQPIPQYPPQPYAAGEAPPPAPYAPPQAPPPPPPGHHGA
ncbi:MULTISPECIES: hypothetical protein [unclassified Microbacterium]|uniref:hypothetical protein n=1 Tax=unclassified Microbacterium TaxID=2609290 RepID=UPI001D547F04|nr:MULTISPECIES: hypothetical protein [unclassified Microbacterium]CAH0134770.1 hypothetical protein SRABI121_00863 [Microbacterium sp. Bi121]HWK77271.1 hypothetical protein [Microbacterium sp.]